MMFQEINTSLVDSTTPETLFFQAAQDIKARFAYEGLSSYVIQLVRDAIWGYHATSRRSFVGVVLKKQVGNLSRLSNAYTKQSRFVGSCRQIRGKVLEHLLVAGKLHVEELEILVNDPEQRTLSVINTLLAENFLEITNGMLSLKK